jgi:hypothetical protein
MTPAETLALVRLVAVAHDREADESLAAVWYATIGHLPYGLARQALLELLKASPYLPRPADILERARLISMQEERERAKRAQLDGRTRHAIAAAEVPATHRRTGPDMIRHVLGRLRDAGSDPANGKFLGPDRCAQIAEDACREWLDRTRGPR